ncbi:MAG: hypothetical protein QM500_12225 [Methylococcales bacterium]
MASSSIDEYYYVNVRQDGKLAPRLYRCSGQIIRKDTEKVVMTVYGEGATATSADSKARYEAKSWVYQNGEPSDWEAGN